MSTYLTLAFISLTLKNILYRFNPKFNLFLDESNIMPKSYWIILFIFSCLSVVNYAFRYEQKIEVTQTGKTIVHRSVADYYEEKCKANLRKKFPYWTKIVNRILYIISEMMIIIILLTMGVILTIQTPNMLFWGSLILSLTLQYVVVCATDSDSDLYIKCARRSRVLKIYSMIVLVL